MEQLSRLERKIAERLIQEKHSELDREKIAFGVKLIMNDLWKLVVVYIIAAVLDCFFLTLFTHMVFFLLRNVAFGFHFQNNFVCLILSVLTLPVAIALLGNFEMDSAAILAVALAATLILLVFAPIGTKKRPIFNQNHKRYLKKKMVVRLIFLWALFFLADAHLQKYIGYGVVLQAASVLAQKMIGGLEHVQNISGKGCS